MRKLVTIASCLSVVLGSLFWQEAARGDPLSDLPAAIGVGETVLLVVGDVTSPSEAAARRDTLNTRFGALQGFSVDATDAYDVRAALVQTTPDASSIRCSAIGADCPKGLERVLVPQPVGLRYVEGARFPTFAFPSPCGGRTTPPCQRSRFVELFGEHLEFTRGRAVIATAFRTRQGAEEFIAFARAVGVRGLVTVQALKLGGGDIGLGQEPHPDGSGPLTGPIPGQTELQR